MLLLAKCIMIVEYTSTRIYKLIWFKMVAMTMILDYIKMSITQLRFFILDFISLYCPGEGKLILCILPIAHVITHVEQWAVKYSA